ncbi:hypothetical protein FSP39_002931 [Pinctada imbricata]|uniref:Uncharacterized protein n=1 Tax=Pinctada imbricata TaxID=66713 RepID=A0AA88XHJ4_PINIB|nr:hypothetical protein FSP39_002931 [Pinctada imbricata]
MLTADGQTDGRTNGRTSSTYRPELLCNPAKNLTSENDLLRRKLWKVKKQRDEFSCELKEIKEKQKVENLLKSYATTRDVYVQTEPSRFWQPPQIKKKEESSQKLDVENANKLLSMHNQMMRRYEKEVRMNMNHVDTITELNLKVSDLEKKLKEERDEVIRLNREVMNLEVKRARSVAKSNVKQERSRSLSPEDNLKVKVRAVFKVGHTPRSGLISMESFQISGGKSLEQLRSECGKMRKENDKLRKELRGLDLGFFEEIEDLKFSLQQSTKLNKEYEKTLRKLCMRFSVPYPHPEKVMDVKR